MRDFNREEESRTKEEKKERQEEEKIEKRKQGKGTKGGGALPGSMGHVSGCIGDSMFMAPGRDSRSPSVTWTLFQLLSACACTAQGQGQAVSVLFVSQTFSSRFFCTSTHLRFCPSDSLSAGGCSLCPRVSHRDRIMTMICSRSCFVAVVVDLTVAIE